MLRIGTRLFARARLCRKIMPIPFCLAVSACSPLTMEDLTAYVDDVHARPGTPVERVFIKPIPRTPSYIPRERDPFQPFYNTKVQSAPLPLPSKYVHPLEELEAFPLDSLRMVGTLLHDDQTWGLLRAPDGVIHRVRSGNYLGQNNGKVTEIMEARIELREVVQGQGRWWERPASLALVLSN